MLADVVVIYGVRAWGRDIVARYRVLGIPVIVIDLGYIDRVNNAQEFEDGFLYVGLGGLGKIPANAPDDRAAALNVQVAEPKAGPIKRALICGQVQFDASHDMSGQELISAYNAIRDALEGKGVEVEYRPHPYANLPPHGLRRASPGDIREVVRRYDLVCSINSNAGLDALLEGLPVMIAKPCHYQSLAYPVGTDIGAIKAPHTNMVRDLINRLSYAQWRAGEISSGEPFRFMQAQGLIPWTS